MGKLNHRAGNLPNVYTLDYSDGLIPRPKVLAIPHFPISNW